MKKDGLNIKAHPAYSVYCALDLLKYYDFCNQEDIGIFWCELNHPLELDIRRQSVELRQLAIAEIDLVLDKYQGHINLNVDVLERYRATLMDNSYLIDPLPVPDMIKWHQDMETTLNKNVKFVDLWPNLIKKGIT